MKRGLIQAATWRSVTLVLFETCLIVAAVVAAAYVRLGSMAWSLVLTQDGLLKSLMIAYVCQFCMYYSDLYDDPRVTADRRELLMRLLQALGATSLILAMLYYWFPGLMLGRGIFLISALFVTAAILTWRVGFGWLYESYTGKIALENLRPSWLIFSSGFHSARWQLALKRLIDVVGSSVGLLVTLPILLPLAAAIRLGSHGPALYRQQRVGLDGAVFTVFKLRSMRSDAEATTGAVWAKREDTRVTPLGRIMRRTRLDELPQFWNVLRGDMSLVGPRPERPEFVGTLSQQIPFYGQRHVVKPGLTGWAQVRYTYGASVEDAMEKLQYDLYYIKNFSVGFDIFILFETLRTVIASGGI